MSDDPNPLPAASTRNLSTWQLAELADCATPDRGDGHGAAFDDMEGRTPSPGATFLRHVADTYDDRRAWATSNGDELVGDDLWEMADGCVPIYTHTVWTTFADLAAYQEDLSEYGEIEPDDLTRTVGMRALFEIARRLLGALHQRAAELADDEDGDR